MEEPMASPTTSSSRGTCKCGGADDVKEKKTATTTKKKKCELVGYEELPEWLKDNEFIHGYYRCEWPMKETILSIFSIHNETLNVWTHLLGFLLFLCLTIFTAMVIPNGGSSSRTSSRSRSNATAMDYYHYWGDLMVMANMTGLLRDHEALAACLLLHPAHLSQHEQISTSCPTNTSSSFSLSHHHHHQQQQQHAMQDAGEVAAAAAVSEPITRWPVFAYLGGAMACLLASTACHLLLCHSERANYVTLRLDYAGIAALIVASFLPIVHYSFLCDAWLRRLYTGSIAAFGAAAVSASLVPAFQSPELRPLRAALFSGMAASGVVPVAHKLALYGGAVREAASSARCEAAMGALYGLGVAVYAARVPERWFPGRFDLVGHSHQLFHLLVVAGAYAHYLAALEYLKWRDAVQC
ncbi:heptahelical transmembrane protein 4-like isoform X2 [Oryza brachyantha]|uniref:heptahelical transmembrane protein 4-like isoform X2 n=1 Tax=Oryza brachyantha TaxID=4533 RepID=UPI001AD96256|nr:heptahelical transmembrane protein 4-like isoform X2 [Oryza brachyantha]